MHVIGTAGHVDHGKSTLVAALTGIHPDRLKEEREREMTIDLGFAWLNLSNGEALGIVDVPGHRDFIENMLSGVGGIDAVLFVIAADEGVMPQTREHLAILDILQVAKGVIALTKVDLIDNPDWLHLVEMDIREAFGGSVLSNAPIVHVSARTKTGLDDLMGAMVQCLAETPQKPDLGRPRLPVDRVFTMAGFGTVVTGTLLDGQFRIGDEVEVLPSGLRGRVRGLQTHKQKEEIAQPGSRTAVNISGLEMAEIRRGDVIAHPGRYQATGRVDVQVRLRADISSPLKHSSEVKFFIGASEVIARARVLGAEQLAPGDEGWLQLEFNEPVVAVRGDRYILRRPSPGETLGGGAVLDPQPKERHKRFDQQVLARFLALSHGSASEVLLQAAQSLGIVPLKDVVSKARLEGGAAKEAILDLVHHEKLMVLEGDDVSPQSDCLVVDGVRWQRETEKALREVKNFHQKYPLKRGMPREALKSRLRMQQRAYLACLPRWINQGELEDDAGTVKIPGYEVQFTGQQQERVIELLEQFRRSPYTPPSVKEVMERVGEEIYSVLLERGDLVQASQGVVFHSKDVATMRDTVVGEINQAGSISLARFRDLFNTSRKYAQAFLEFLDVQGVTLREGEVRKLKAR